MSDRTNVDVEVAPRVQIAKKSMWHSIMSNPKVLFIAFFASLVFSARPLKISSLHGMLTSPIGSVASNMATSKVFLASP